MAFGFRGACWRQHRQQQQKQTLPKRAASYTFNPRIRPLFFPTFSWLPAGRRVRTQRSSSTRARCGHGGTPARNAQQIGALERHGRAASGAHIHALPAAAGRAGSGIAATETTRSDRCKGAGRAGVARGCFASRRIRCGDRKAVFTTQILDIRGFKSAGDHERQPAAWASDQGRAAPSRLLDGGQAAMAGGGLHAHGGSR